MGSPSFFPPLRRLRPPGLDAVPGVGRRSDEGGGIELPHIRNRCGHQTDPAWGANGAHLVGGCKAPLEVTRVQPWHPVGPR